MFCLTKELFSLLQQEKQKFNCKKKLGNEVKEDEEEEKSRSRNTVKWRSKNRSKTILKCKGSKKLFAFFSSCTEHLGEKQSEHKRTKT